MRETTMSRRGLLGTGACALAATAVVPGIAAACAANGLSPGAERIVRKYYGAWEARDWHTLSLLLADGFTFTSPDDDHDSRSLFKTRCWDSNVDLIEHFDLQLIAGNGGDALVMYVAHIRNGKTIKNVEHLRVREGKVQSVRCYFGRQDSYPAAVEGHRS